MHTIEIDEDVFRHLKEQAEPFVETTPNEVLRRLFALPRLSASKSSEDANAARSLNVAQRSARSRDVRKRQTRAQLSVLVENGLLRNGETLTLHDYRRSPVKGSQAKVVAGALHWNGTSYSMSDLASQLLRKEGYVADAVRGPAHWVTGEGLTVSQLWERHLSGR